MQALKEYGNVKIVKSKFKNEKSSKNIQQCSFKRKQEKKILK